MYPKYIKRCRVCGHSNLVDVVDLGHQFLQGAFVKEGVIAPPKRRLPTKLVRCDVQANQDACGLVQMAHTFPPEILYSNYWYRSGTNQTMCDHLKGIVNSALLLTPKRDEPLTVLDIGCNDCTLLSNYPEGIRLCGVDPSDIANSAELEVELVNTVFPSPRVRAAFKDTRFDIITSIAMFYDLEDPVDFAKAIAELLSEQGVWILEMSYLPLMLAQNSFDTICHEHVEYYSLAVLERICRRAGLRVFKAELNEINGGSIRCYVSHDSWSGADKPSDGELLSTLRIWEFEQALDTSAPYEAFVRRICKLREDTRALLAGFGIAGKKVHIYGASTKGNVLLQWYGITHEHVEAAAERNPFKVGGHTLGTNIPIISEEESRARKPDYYLVLPWHFKREFLERERETIEAGATFLFPLPEIELVDAKNLDAKLAELRAEESNEQARMLKLLENVAA